MASLPRRLTLRPALIHRLSRPLSASYRGPQANRQRGDVEGSLCALLTFLPSFLLPLLDEQHLAIRRQRPQVRRHRGLDACRPFRAASAIVGHDGVAHVLRVLLGRPGRSCSSAVASLSDVRLKSSTSLVRSLSSFFLRATCTPAALPADTARRRSAPWYRRRRRQDVPVGHQHHQLRFDVHCLDVLLEVDLVARFSSRLLSTLYFSNAVTSGVFAAPAARQRCSSGSAACASPLPSPTRRSSCCR